MAEQPQIRFITRKWAPAVGGMETYCLRLAEQIGRQRRLEVIALPGRPDGRAPAPASLLWFAIRTAVRLLISPPAEIIHVSDMASWPLAWIAALRHPTSRIILSAHGSDLSYAKRPGGRARLYKAYLALAPKCLPRATVIANSQWIGGLARETGFRQVTVVPLATALRAEAGRSHNGALLFAGRLMPSKGLSFLIEQVLPRLGDAPPLRVAGTVWDERERRLLSAPGIVYLGALPAAALAQEYAEAMCTLVPSQAPEGFGLAAVEAAACGGVVIAADHSGLAEAVLPGAGFLAPADDPAAWAERIEAVRGWSDSDRAEFTTAASSAARIRFCWSRVARETLAVYEATAPHRPTPTAPDRTTAPVPMK